MWHAWARREKCPRFLGKPEGKRPLGRPRRRWENGIRMDLGEIGGGVDWIQLAHYKGRLRAVLNTMMNIRILISVSQPLGCDSQEGREVSSLKEKCKNACILILIIVVGRGNVTVFL
jgi:hypothetical protein